MTIQTGTVIPAVRTPLEYAKALGSAHEYLFLLYDTVSSLPEHITLAKKHGKRLFIHMDMIDGLGRDAAAVDFLASLGAFGIISTRSPLVKYAKSRGLRTVQRFFIVDGKSVETALDAVSKCPPDYIELMPGLVCKEISAFASRGVPVIAGGLIETRAEADAAITAGAAAVSTSKWERI